MSPDTSKDVGNNHFPIGNSTHTVRQLDLIVEDVTKEVTIQPVQGQDNHSVTTVGSRRVLVNKREP